MLDFLGIELSNTEAVSPEKSYPLKLWREHIDAYTTFIRVSRHAQWVRNPADANQILSIDGVYLINYLKAIYTGDNLADALDDVYCIVEGWLKARADQAADVKSSK